MSGASALRTAGRSRRGGVAPSDQAAGIDRSVVGRMGPPTDLFASGGRWGCACPRPGPSVTSLPPPSVALFARGDSGDPDIAGVAAGDVASCFPHRWFRLARSAPMRRCEGRPAPGPRAHPADDVREPRRSPCASPPDQPEGRVRLPALTVPVTMRVDSVCVEEGADADDRQPPRAAGQHRSPAFRPRGIAHDVHTPGAGRVTDHPRPVQRHPLDRGEAPNATPEPAGSAEATGPATPEHAGRGGRPAGPRRTCAGARRCAHDVQSRRFAGGWAPPCGPAAPPTDAPVQPGPADRPRRGPPRTERRPATTGAGEAQRARSPAARQGGACTTGTRKPRTQ